MLLRKKYLKLTVYKLLLMRVSKTSPFPPSGSGWFESTPLFSEVIHILLVNSVYSHYITLHKTQECYFLGIKLAICPSTK